VLALSLDEYLPPNQPNPATLVDNPAIWENEKLKYNTWETGADEAMWRAQLVADINN
jgi:hypothetical protein